MKDGVRRQLATASADLDVGPWYRLEAQHQVDRIACWLDGRKLLEAVDASGPAGGGVGLWAKADSLTSFDDLSLEPLKR